LEDRILTPDNRLFGRLVLALIGIVFLTACGGDGDGAGGGTPTGPSPLIVITPDRNAGANSIAMRAGPGSTATILQLEIFATEVTGVQAQRLTPPRQLLDRRLHRLLSGVR